LRILPALCDRELITSYMTIVIANRRDSRKYAKH